MNCHTDKTKFCDQCHNYAGVTNKCWDCHIYPKQVKRRNEVDGTSRRGFLKIAGLTLAGPCRPSQAGRFFRTLEQPEPSPTPETLAKKKWGMAIELKKCWSGGRMQRLH